VTLTPFHRKGIAAIEETKRLGNGIAAEVVMAKLDDRSAAARTNQAKVRHPANFVAEQTAERSGVAGIVGKLVFGQIDR
jgi:hypothetical protein